MFAVRGTVTTAFRAPSVGRALPRTADGFPNVSDPCSTVRGNLDNPTVAANCAADGFDGGVPDDRTQLLRRIGGSPVLTPETADTLTLGLVLEDQLVRGLTASIDYYKIRDRQRDPGYRIGDHSRQLLPAGGRKPALLRSDPAGRCRLHSERSRPRRQRWRVSCRRHRRRSEIPHPRLRLRPPGRRYRRNAAPGPHPDPGGRLRTILRRQLRPVRGRGAWRQPTLPPQRLPSLGARSIQRRSELSLPSLVRRV